MWRIFSWTSWPYVGLISRNSCHVFSPFLHWIPCFVGVGFDKLFTHVGYNRFALYVIWQYNLPFCWLFLFLCRSYLSWRSSNNHFSFVSLALMDVSCKKLLWPSSKRVFPVFSSTILMESCLTFWFYLCVQCCVCRYLRPGFGFGSVNEWADDKGCLQSLLSPVTMIWRQVFLSWNGESVNPTKYLCNWLRGPKQFFTRFLFMNNPINICWILLVRILVRNLHPGLSVVLFCNYPSSWDVWFGVKWHHRMSLAVFL